jgi:hypothetical protein
VGHNRGSCLRRYEADNAGLIVPGPKRTQDQLRG